MLAEAQTSLIYTFCDSINITRSTQIEILWNHDRLARQDVNKANCTYENTAVNDSYN